MAGSRMSKRRIARRSCELGCIVRHKCEIAGNTHSQRQQSRLDSTASEIQFIKFLALCNCKMSEELRRLPGVNRKGDGERLGGGSWRRASVAREQSRCHAVTEWPKVRVCEIMGLRGTSSPGSPLK